MFDQPTWTITPYGQSRGFTYDGLGFLPGFLSLGDPRPAARQIDERYAHGGGWRPSSTIKYKPGGLIYLSLDDLTLGALAYADLRQERLFFYEHEYLAIVQPSGRAEIARID